MHYRIQVATSRGHWELIVEISLRFGHGRRHGKKRGND